MAETISVRFDEVTRELLDEEAAARKVGTSTLVRQLAEGELLRIRRARIAAESKAVAAYLTEHPTAFDDDDPAGWFAPPEAAASV